MVLSSLGTFLGQNHTLQILRISTWLIGNMTSFTDQLLAVLKCKMFLKFKISLVSPDRDILWPWDFPNTSPWQKKLIGESIFNFYWSQQKLVSGL